MENFGSFKIPGHSTKRQWSVYVCVAQKIESSEKKLYVGKTGDNREGCNPVISRLGNHFSFNKIHSQIRNRLENTEDYNYEYFYLHFGEYRKENSSDMKDKTNELERRLNKLIQKRAEGEIELLNPYSGRHFINKEEKEKREKIVTLEDDKLLRLFVNKIFNPATNQA